jgi:threonine dehydratase
LLRGKSFIVFPVFVVEYRVAIPLCGGNIDTTVLGRVIDRGLVADSRLIKVWVTVSDRPGGLSELCKVFVRMGARYVLFY